MRQCVTHLHHHICKKLTYRKKHRSQQQKKVTQQPIAVPPPQQEYVLGFDPYSPEFADQLMAVFKQDSLSHRLQNNEKKQTKIRTLGARKKKISNKAAKAQEHRWTSQVMQDISSALPFKSNLDLGSNSKSDVYVELSAAKNWALFSNWTLDASQTFRYGAQSKNFSETDFNFSQKSNATDFFSNQISVIKTYEAQYTWSDKLFLKQNFLHDHQLTYGLYTSGIYDKDKKEVELQNWGPYLGWRIPLWRTWLYLSNDISYYRDNTANDGYSFNANLQLEAIF